MYCKTSPTAFFSQTYLFIINTQEYDVNLLVILPREIPRKLLHTGTRSCLLFYGSTVLRPQYRAYTLQVFTWKRPISDIVFVTEK